MCPFPPGLAWPVGFGFQSSFFCSARSFPSNLVLCRFLLNTKRDLLNEILLLRLEEFSQLENFRAKDARETRFGQSSMSRLSSSDRKAPVTFRATLFGGRRPRLPRSGPKTPGDSEPPLRRKLSTDKSNWDSEKCEAESDCRLKAAQGASTESHAQKSLFWRFRKGSLETATRSSFLREPRALALKSDFPLSQSRSALLLFCIFYYFPIQTLRI